MRITITVLTIFFWICGCSSSAQVGNGKGTRKEYQLSLESLLKDLENSDDLSKIEFLIPTSPEEAQIYFGCDYKNDLSKPFQQLQHKIVQISSSGNVGILTKYLYLSQYVDGYFAEDYFDNIEKIAKVNDAFFCKTLQNARKENVKRLDEILKKHCVK